MAIWQYRGWLLPCQPLDGKDAARRIHDGAPDFWAALRPGWLAPCAAQLHLNLGTSWDPRTVLWGDHEGSYISEALEGGKIVEADCALDARTFDLRRAKLVARVFQEHQRMLITPEGRILPRSAEAIHREVSQSPAGRFAQDPRGFLTTLRRGKN